MSKVKPQDNYLKSRINGQPNVIALQIKNNKYASHNPILPNDHKAATLNKYKTIAATIALRITLVFSKPTNTPSNQKLNTAINGNVIENKT